eukprot:6201905-Pleurochrysis_carterae.AAC.2
MYTGEPENVSSSLPPSVYGRCSKFIDGEPCGNEVFYPAPHFCESCISCRVPVRRQHPQSVSVSVDTWRNKIRNDLRLKLEKANEAAAGVQINVCPTPISVFKELHDFLCDLQPKNGGGHLTVLRQEAGQRGGDLQHWTFSIVSGDLVALFFKSTFVFGTQQGSAH